MSPLSKHRRRASPWAALALMSGIGVQSALAQNAPPPNDRDHAFVAESDIAMTKMMNGMAVKPAGNIDNDFVAMMTPHHQGAIDMAVAYLRYGQNEQLRRIAQEIVIEQQQEILAMRLAIGQPLPPSAPAPTQPSPSPTTAPRSDAAHHAHTANPQESR